MHRDVQACGDKLWERFNRGKEPQSWYYHSSAKVLKALAKEPEVAASYAEFCKLVEAVFGPEPAGCLQ